VYLFYDEAKEKRMNEHKCPRCGEADFEKLVWRDDDFVVCQTCRTVYDPGDPGSALHKYDLTKEREELATVIGETLVGYIEQHAPPLSKHRTWEGRYVFATRQDNDVWLVYADGLSNQPQRAEWEANTLFSEERAACASRTLPLSFNAGSVGDPDYDIYEQQLWMGEKL
jgi:hypothetical protein